MSSERGWFETEGEYRSRVAREANERTITDSKGSAPAQGFFETKDEYRDRVAREANECTIKSATGSAPSQGFFESRDSYNQRMEREANERTVERSSGSAPSQRFFETRADYETRVRKEANEAIIKDSVGSSPGKHWWEDNHDYRSRIAHEARKVRASAARTSTTSDTDSAGHSYGSTPSNDGGSLAGTTSGSFPETNSSSDRAPLVIVALVAFLALLAATVPWSRLIHTGDGPPAASRPQGGAGKDTKVKPGAGVSFDWSSRPRLSLRGIGPIRVGMAASDAESHLGGRVIKETYGSNDCYYLKPTSAPPGISFMVTHGTIARIDVTTPNYASLSGATVGQSEEGLIERYANQLTVTPHYYEPAGHNLTFIPKDPSDQALRMVFETDGRVITRFRVGRLPEVEYVERCL